MFFMSSLICLCGCFTACSGNSDDNGEEPDNGEVTGPITLTVDKAKIEANGTDMATFTVTDANGKVLTTSEYMKNVYFVKTAPVNYLEYNSTMSISFTGTSISSLVGRVLISPFKFSWSDSNHAGTRRPAVVSRTSL